MSKVIPTLSKFMTTMPHTIQLEQNIELAEKLMKDHHIRHLPVMQNDQIVGILSDRDIQLLKSFSSVDFKTTIVKDACTYHPYTTKPEASLDQVCREMASHKYGCALVIDNARLVGIFTWIDALNALSTLLETRLK
jgi:acetoin utilization protein AcuB